MTPADAAGRDDRITLRFLATPADTAAGGRSIAAGSVMEWIDKAGYACAVGWSGAYCVTAYVGNVRHRRPIPPGSLIEVQARIAHTGRTSMHVVTTVSFADLSDPDYRPATTCMLVFVAKSPDGGSMPVPAWTPRSAADTELAGIAAGRTPARAAIRRLMIDARWAPSTDAPSTTLRFLVPPGVVNWGGNAHGGTVMRWIDEAAFACTASWTRDGEDGEDGEDGADDASSAAVAVYSGGIHFFAPLAIGALVEIEARVLLTTARSVHLGVRVTSADPRRPAVRTLTTQCLTVFVVPDAGGRAQPVPSWRPAAVDDVAAHDSVQRVIALRERIVPIPASLALTP